MEKSTFGKTERLDPLPLLAWQRLIRTFSGARDASSAALEVIQHPYLPRPPQTRAASFKRLYPK
jgi:hypothetical protein